MRTQAAVPERVEAQRWPPAWAVDEGEACAWAWAPPQGLRHHMQAAAEGMQNWAPLEAGASLSRQQAAWSRMTQVAIEHASVAMAAYRDAPSAARSPDGRTSALDAAFKATQLVDEAVRRSTQSRGKRVSVSWSRWGELQYLREVLRSMRGEDHVEPAIARASDGRFAVTDEDWTEKIAACRAHRLRRGARKRAGPATP